MTGLSDRLSTLVTGRDTDVRRRKAGAIIDGICRLADLLPNGAVP
jgi:hypothetical protein